MVKWTGLFGLAAMLLAVALPGIASAQPAPNPTGINPAPTAAGAGAAADSVTASEAIEQAKRTYGPPPPRRNCANKPASTAKAGGDQKAGDEIVVCGKQDQDDSQFRVKSSRELDPNSPQALRDGLPRAPNVAGAGIFQGKPTVGKLCLVGGCPPPPAYMIDLKKLPDAPAGSDADLIAKGEKPAD